MEMIRPRTRRIAKHEQADSGDRQVLSAASAAQSRIPGEYKLSTISKALELSLAP